MNPLCARDDLLSSDEDVVGVAVPLVRRVRHCVEWPNLQ